jgi:hypothetical protein
MKNIYTFHRAEGWYPVELINNMEAAHHILFNPGTVKVVNETTGEILHDENKTSLDEPLIEQKHQIP